MWTLEEKFDQAITSKTEAIKKSEVELKNLKRLRDSVRKFPLDWPYEVNAKNAKRVAIQARILHFLFERHDELKTISSPRSKGLTTHQIWRRLNPSSTGTSSTTFRNHLLDLQKKRLVKKFAGTDDWTPTPAALQKRISGGKK